MLTTRLRLYTSTAAVAAAMLGAASAQAQSAPPTPPAQTAPPAADQKNRDITVTGTRSDVIATPDRVSFNVANDLQAQTGTVADALRSVPGVEVDMQGQVSLRGDTGVKILVDGRPSAMMNGESRGDVLLSMPAGQIERVEVITNPSAAMSPEGSGGVINLVSKQARKNTQSATVRATAGLEGRGSLNLNGTRSAGALTLTGDVGYRRFTGDPTAVQIRSRLDPVSDTFIDSRLDTEMHNRMSGRTARFGAEYDLDKANRLSTELTYNKVGVDVERSDSFVSDVDAVSYDRESDIALSNRGLGARASWIHTLAGDDHELSVDLEAESGRFRREVDGVTNFASGGPEFEHIRNAGDRGEYSAKVDYKRPIGETSSLNLGYQADLEKAEFDFVGERGDSLDALLPVPALTNSFDYDETIHALYGTYSFQLGKFETQAGLRLEQAETSIDQITDDVQVENDYFRAYPTLHVGYELAEGQQLRGSYSRRIQRPSPQDLNPYTLYIDPLTLRRGNPLLRPEVTDSFELSWQTRKGGTFYSVTGFHRRSKGGVTDVIEDIGDGVFLTTRENLATATRTGVDVIANGRFSKQLSYNVSGTLMRHEIDPRIGGVSMSRSGTTATVRANLSWQPTPRDFLQLNAVYSGKQLLPQGYRLSNGVLNLGYRRKLSERLSFLVTGQNVLDTARFVADFDTPTLRDRITQKGIGRVVLLGLTYNMGGQSRQKEPGFDFQQGAGDTTQ